LSGKQRESCFYARCRAPPLTFAWPKIWKDWRLFFDLCRWSSNFAFISRLLEQNSLCCLDPLSISWNQTKFPITNETDSSTQEAGELWTWGYGAQGRLGLNDGQDRLVPTRVDPQHFAHAPISAVAVTAGGAL
jgi:hypothetical protein